MEFKMADEAKLQVLESKIAVARRELNNIRTDIYSMKRMFAEKLKDIKEMVDKGKQEYTVDTDSQRLSPDHHSCTQDTHTRQVGFLSEVEPIGFVESCFKEKNGIPRQPSVCPTAKAKMCVALKGLTNPEHSLDGLQNFSHVWIIFVFHKNTNKAVKAKVKPPRLDGAKVGVFASRSPHRPNPIGLTLAKLDAIIGDTLFLSGIDLLDGTPVLDIKPYVPDYDKPVENLPLVEDKLEIDNSVENMDISSLQDPVNQPLPTSLGEELFEQSRIFPIKEHLDLKPESTTLSIAEWIRKPPIKELDVKFSDEAIHQISRFHRKKLCVLPDHSHSTELHEEGEHLTAYKCICTKMHDTKSENFAVKTTSEKLKTCKPIQNSQSKVSLNHSDGSYVETDEDSNSEEELKLSSPPKDTLNEKSNQIAKDAKRGCFPEELLPCRDKSSLLCENVADDFKNAFESKAEPDIVQPSNVCIYQLEMLSSPEEAKQAIADILKADPRSVYRRNRCQDQLYHFSIDTMNVTCRFEESVVEVLQVEPVCYRNVKDISQNKVLAQ